jgi:hypothetical protein
MSLYGPGSGGWGRAKARFYAGFGAGPAQIPQECARYDLYNGHNARTVHAQPTGPARLARPGRSGR